MTILQALSLANSILTSIIIGGNTACIWSAVRRHRNQFGPRDMGWILYHEMVCYGILFFALVLQALVNLLLDDYFMFIVTVGLSYMWYDMHKKKLQHLKEFVNRDWE